MGIMSKKQTNKYLCEICGEPDSRINQAHKIRLCDECVNTDEYRLICKSKAKEKYFLTEKDLADIDSLSAPNPNSRRNDYVLFNRREIIEIFCKKYDVNPYDDDEIKAKRIEMMDHREQQREKRAQNSKNRQVKRKQELKAVLEAMGLELRADSKLCQGYIDGTIKDKCIGEIVERMCEMKYLYDYCDMDNCFKKTKRERAEELEYEYHSDMSLFDEAELIALRKYGHKGSYPKKWPQYQWNQCRQL